MPTLNDEIERMEARQKKLEQRIREKKRKQKQAEDAYDLRLFRKLQELHAQDIEWMNSVDEAKRVLEIEDENAQRLREARKAEREAEKRAEEEAQQREDELDAAGQVGDWGQ